jgi:hypothetical protein
LILIKFYVNQTTSITVAAVYDINSVRPFDNLNRRFKSHSRHGCLYAFILCIGNGLATG